MTDRRKLWCVMSDIDMNGKSTELWCAALMLHVVCKGR